MDRFKWWILGLLVATSAAHAVDGPAVATDNVKARLVSETTSMAPGQSVWLALELDIREGWHTYWRNPGDSGQATSLRWTLPSGFTAGAILWTAPHRFELPPLVNYGYGKRALHLVEITAPGTLVPGSPVTLQAKASWLVCADVCIPADATLHITLPVTAKAGAPDPRDAPLFAAARAELPQPAPAPAEATLRGDQLVLNLGPGWGAALSRADSLTFYPYDQGSIDYAAPQIESRNEAGVQLSIKTGDDPPQGDTIQGLLVTTRGTGTATTRVPLELSAALTVVSRGAPRAGTPAAGIPTVGATPASAPAAAAPSADAPALASLILLAVLGGLILNLMPCVFPVLSIKAIGLVEQAKKHPAAVRAKGLVFAAGVIASMLTLAIVLLALRAGGEQIGWGFQLQSPLFVTLMVYLLLAVGLNLSGVFDVGGGLAGVGDGLTRGDSYHAAFFTGVLTTLVATPCTAPFMAAAVGAALTQSSVVALTIFAGLGVGLSLPYLTLSFAPWLRRTLPKPGAWMDTLKQVFAFPMYASAAWLLWVLAQQTSSLGLGAALAGAILVALAAWAYEKSKATRASGRRVAMLTALVAVVLAVVLPWRVDGIASASTGGLSPAEVTPSASIAATDAWQPYDAGRLAAITAAGRPLLVNFTASWCLTCLVNERNAFADSGVEALFHDKGVTLMKGDWTRRDPAITAALSTFGRAGVPLYVAYNAKPGRADPIVLPQLLTPSLVHDTFKDLPDGR